MLSFASLTWLSLLTILVAILQIIIQLNGNYQNSIQHQEKMTELRKQTLLQEQLLLEHRALEEKLNSFPPNLTPASTQCRLGFYTLRVVVC